ncbi:MAG: phosphate acyltransferase [Candidatus Puniceispirillaceae bacterium]
MAFVRATSKAVIESAVQSYEAGLCVPHLIGETDEIKEIAAQSALSLDGCLLHHTDGEAAAIEAAISLAQQDVIKGFVKGQLHTDVFMGGLVNKQAGMRTAQRMVHVFAMFPPDGGTPVMISDGAVNVAPNQETRIAAALNVASLCRAIEIERPKIAILSATESQIASVPSSIEAAEIAQACAAQDLSADYEGPLSLDLAIAPAAVAQKKMEGSPVAGYANGLIMPDIVSGNALFKSLVWFGGASAAGLVMGARLPIILTSRSDPAPARLASIALGAIMQNAQQRENKGS